ncbi:rhomboid family intramembrane serine protease [Chitinophaga silvisoli]|uniref:Rhomboid family intramembrane serine protease n=1 Tax=Chitinophaga silvisoli TaxID=2291814 RepID=A0A3E1NVL3_9BACT|nr:rhomboid family intramembrane serine protease [Chitinophaga silvisoli]RFM31959.1 rhomboid family intramembrane serine protease [Chitinophaga silvisoli]
MNGTSFRSDIRYWLRQGNTINHLLFWNIVVFLALNIPRVIAYFVPAISGVDKLIYDQISLHAFLPVFITKPWGLVTYMFSHVEIFHIFFNMLTLYWFGNLFRSFLGNHRVLPLYLLGGLIGGLAYLLVFNIFKAPDLTLIGASASVVAILVACATKIPNYEVGLMFIGSVRLKWLALVVVVLDIISIGKGNEGGIVAHLGGALFGFLYIKMLDNGTDLCQPLVWLFNRRVRVEAMQSRTRRSFKPKKSPLKVVKSHPEENKQLRLDQLLDKINDRGMESLSPEEKAWLNKMSQE